MYGIQIKRVLGERIGFAQIHKMSIAKVLIIK
jgi:hypothetical protein